MHTLADVKRVSSLLDSNISVRLRRAMLASTVPREVNTCGNPAGGLAGSTPCKQYVIACSKSKQKSDAVNQ